MDQGIDSRAAWVRVLAALAIMSITFGAPYIATVALTQIAAEVGGHRSVPAAATSLAWLGTGVGGLAMGWVANRLGVRLTVIWGVLVAACGLWLASGGAVWQLYVGYGLLVGLLGNAGINAPLYVYATRWFDRRRGTALALIASGQYVAGAFWPPVFERLIAAMGWKVVMQWFGVGAALVVIPLALVFLDNPPASPAVTGAEEAAGQARRSTVFGLEGRVAFGLLALASFLCCIPMAMPQTHLIAFCGDLGFAAGRGAAMISLLLVCAFISRQFWGWLSDRIGGLLTLVACSVGQATAMLGFLVTQSEAGLFAVSAAFGLGFAGLIPAYVLTAREHFPASEAHWRMPVLLLTGMGGMAAGGWIAGVIYDGAGSYAPAFLTGVVANLANLAILIILVAGARRARLGPAPA